jgi:hypothetical protein
VATERPAPTYVVLCAFQRFEIWEPGQYPVEPRMRLTLDELPDRYEALLFLAGPSEEPLFHHTSRALTTEAATALAGVYQRLLDRGAAKPPVVSNFMLKLVWLFFAEDYRMIEGHRTEQILHLMETQEHWKSYLMLGGLFSVLNDPDEHVRRDALRGLTYVNGDLFARPSLVQLGKDEAKSPGEIARFDWKAVDPTIFGSMMEGFLGTDARSTSASITRTRSTS